MPILAHILIEAVRDEIVLFATDLDIAIRTHLPAEVETPGGISVSAKKLYEIVRELSTRPSSSRPAMPTASRSARDRQPSLWWACRRIFPSTQAF